MALGGLGRNRNEAIVKIKGRDSLSDDLSRIEQNSERVFANMECKAREPGLGLGESAAPVQSGKRSCSAAA